jgi:hypothetical protein
MQGYFLSSASLHYENVFSLFFDLPIPSNRHESEEKKEFY